MLLAVFCHYKEEVLAYVPGGGGGEGKQEEEEEEEEEEELPPKWLRHAWDLFYNQVIDEEEELPLLRSLATQLIEALTDIDTWTHTSNPLGKIINFASEGMMQEVKEILQQYLSEPLPDVAMLRSRRIHMFNTNGGALPSKAKGKVYIYMCVCVYVSLCGYG